MRSKAGCKDPTSFFTTNSSESLNHLIKQKVEWKESQLPKLIESLKAIMNDQRSELQRVVVNRGECILLLSMEVFLSVTFCGFKDE